MLYPEATFMPLSFRRKRFVFANKHEEFLYIQCGENGLGEKLSVAIPYVI
jgi:hypothetical protein